MSTTESKDGESEMEQFPCNFFQAMSVSLNVRLSGGVMFPPVPAQKVVSCWFQSVAQHGAHLQLALVPREGQEDRLRPILVRRKLIPGSKSSINFATPSVEVAGSRSLEAIVLDNIYPQEDLHPAGPARSFLYVNDDNEVKYLVVNVSAAIWDSTTLKSVLESFIGYMHNPRAPVENPYRQLGGWEQHIHDAFKSVPDVPFLPVGDDDKEFPSLKISEILPGETKNARDRRVSILFNSETVKACEVVSKKNDVPLNRLGIASLNRALAEKYFAKNNSKERATIASATHIDPRSMLPSDASTKYLNAVGSLTFGRTITAAELEDDPLNTWLVDEAKRIDEEIVTRLQRGEGGRKILEVVTGNIQQEHHVLAATEWTDHGVYDTRSDGFSVELGHRFDMCPQMTVVSHIEKASGEMKLEVQIAEDQCRTSTVEVLERVRDLWELLATLP